MPEAEPDPRRQRWPQNVRGPFYVDFNCLDCDACREVAPDHFARHDPGGHSFVRRQPVSPEESARCREAKELCPHEAIHDDGRDFDWDLVPAELPWHDDPPAPSLPDLGGRRLD